MSLQAPELEGKALEWGGLLEQALTVPGGLGNTYNRFYEYSYGNRMLLYMQGVFEPVATYNRWQELGRQVLKGSKAKSIMRPIMGKQVTEAGEEVTKLRGFKMVRCLFGVSETEGDDLPEYEPPEWNQPQALQHLDITRVPFTALNGNIQGYSTERKFAINPVAVYPLKTTFHEVGHIVLGHTTKEELVEYQTHRGMKEFQAEATAYLCINELELTDHMDAAESRAYIQHWLSDERPDERSIRQVFNSATQILKAGRMAVAVAEVEG